MKIEVESKLTIKVGTEKLVLNKNDAETLLYSLATALNKSINYGYSNPNWYYTTTLNNSTASLPDHVAGASTGTGTPVFTSTPTTYSSNGHISVSE